MSAWIAQLARAAAAAALALASLAQAAPPVTHWVHANGARVYWVPSEALPMVDVQVDIDAGSRRDPPGLDGLADATQTLFDLGVRSWQGQPARDENALVEAWEELGARFGASVSADRMTFALRSLTQPEVLERAVVLAAQQLAVPAFPAAEWARERERLIASWKEAQTRPQTHAARAFAEAVYGSHPYGREARPESWARIDTIAIERFYREHARTCHARVSIVGAIDRAQADRLVGQLLQGWPSGACAPLATVPEVAALTTPIERRIPFKAAQAHILIGQPGIARSDPDFFTLLLANHVLGGSGFVSRLTREIREQRGLTYGVYSYFSPGRHAGAFTVGLQTRPDQAALAVDLVRQELRRFVSDGPTDAELDEARQSLINGFALRLDSNRKLLDNLSNIGWNDLPLDYLDTWTARLRAVSRDEVMRALRRVLQPERMVTVVVGATP